jgi:hypothetical protein
VEQYREYPFYILKFNNKNIILKFCEEKNSNFFGYHNPMAKMNQNLEIEKGINGGEE